MPNIRKNVYELGSPWAPEILWYARGVAAMQTLPLNNPVSWSFFGAIHGFNVPRWHQIGLPTAPQPSSGDMKTYWNQCQHGSWYFEPWHRGYIWAIESLLRSHIVSLGGPSDWALPYWNYFKKNQNALPPEFASNTWPDGGNNPLFMQARYGPDGDGNVYVDLSDVNLKAVQDQHFTGVDSGGSPGFGGADTGFSHSGSVPGGIEMQPHNFVHSMVGGQSNQTGVEGAMADPDTAGYDPIFWLHHANIDRLWEVWNRSNPGHTNPTDANWVNGPLNSGKPGTRGFVLPTSGQPYKYTPGQVLSIDAMGYGYDDVSSPFPAQPFMQRLQRLGFAAAIQQQVGSAPLPKQNKVELVGANIEPKALQLVGTQLQTKVVMQPEMRSRIAHTLSLLSADVMPDRVFLNLENVKGLADSTVFNVYVNLPAGAQPADHSELLAGTIGLFGVTKASAADGEHGGQGLTFVLEITDIVDTLHLSGNFDVSALDVHLIPRKSVPASAQITIGRISVFRQGS